MELAIRIFGQALVGSAEAAVLALLLAAALRLWRRTLSPGWKYALWFLLLAKLLIPLLPGDVGNQLRWLPVPDTLETRLPVFDAIQSRAENLSAAAAAEASEGTSGVAVFEGEEAASQPASSNRAPDNLLLRIAAAVWLSGIALALLFPLAGHLAMSRALRREPGLTVPRELEKMFARIRADSGIRPGVQLRLTRLVSGPALFGIFSPVVLIPRDLAGRLAEAEWECIFRHELAHYRRKDIWVNLLAYSLVSAHWFNPLAWYGLRRMRIDQESACDANVLNAIASKETYASCMIKLLEIGAARKVALSGVGFFGSKKLIARRIVMIRDYKPARKKALYTGAAVFILAGALLLPSALAADKGEPQPAQAVETNHDSAKEIQLRLTMPEDAKISSRYGYRIHPTTSEKSLHDGIDIAGKAGSDIFAAGAGTVVQSEYDSAKGLTVKIEHGEAWVTEYRHLDKLAVEAGDEVKSGDLIGQMGSTGESTGPHLHYSTLKEGEYVDPLSVTVIGTEAK
ncbi:M56 family metallopeptidase [Cohnella sp.]|uniref:M56 family metallopeptidase n=1 Tax=Cohnella sp. TaxID=1883426 RepID=UPI0035658147